MKKLKVGIAGYGVVGKRRRIFIDQHPQLVTTAVCDRTFPGTGRLPEGTRFYSHYSELLKEDLDILFVCLTNDIAAEVTIAGLERGLHVFCEKPPGRDVQDIINVIKVEKNFPNLKLKYGFNHRYHDSVKKALSLIQSGELGEIINLRGVYGKSKIISFDSDWRTKRAIAGGGILLDQGIHMVDLLRLFAGEFGEIYSFISNGFWHHDVEDNAYALMRTKKNVIAFLHSSATQWQHRFHLEIAMTRGAIVLAGILSGSKSYGDETITIFRAGKSEGSDPYVENCKYSEDNSWSEEIAEFTDCIVNNSSVAFGSSKDALQTMALVYRIYCADSEWKSKFHLNADHWEQYL